MPKLQSFNCIITIPAAGRGAPGCCRRPLPRLLGAGGGRGAAAARRAAAGREGGPQPGGQTQEPGGGGRQQPRLHGELELKPGLGVQLRFNGLIQW